MEKPIGKKENYIKISWIIVLAIALSGICLLVLNLRYVDNFLDLYFGDLPFEMIKQFFWGVIGASISCSLFLSQDKEMNEIESLKDSPNFQILRYPTKEDIHLYVQRLLTSGILAVIGVLVILTGFGYLDVGISEVGAKHKIIFVLSSVLIGLF